MSEGSQTESVAIKTPQPNKLFGSHLESVGGSASDTSAIDDEVRLLAEQC